MFAYIESLSELQLNILCLIKDHEFNSENPLTPQQLVERISAEIKTNFVTTAKLITLLHDYGFIRNLGCRRSWGIELTADEFISVNTLDPVILTPRGLGYLESHDLVMKIMQEAVNKAKVPLEEKTGLLKRIYNEAADKGLDFVAKLCSEVISQ